MIQKKICMLGAFAVGKTSLVARYVHSMFSEKYHTTVGVKIDKKLVTVKQQDLNLLIWDLAGEDDVLKVRSSYLRGAAGSVVVVDGTRPATLEVALDLKSRVQRDAAAQPVVILLNKCDLTTEWAISDTAAVSETGCDVIRTSAKTGEGVQQAFEALAERLLEQHEREK